MFSKIPWLSIGRFALVVTCVLLVLALVVTILPIFLDITALKGPIEETLSTAVKAPVTLEVVRLHPSPWPTFRVSGLQIAGSGEGTPPALAHIDRAEIQLSLFSLMRKQLRLQRLLLSGAIIHAQRPEGRSGNWPISLEPSFQIKQLTGIEFENVTLILEDHQTVKATMGIDRLTCNIDQSHPLELELDGSLEGMPLKISAAGPTLSSLFQATDFPLTLDLALADLTLGLDGSVSQEPGGAQFEFAFDLESPELAFLRSLGYPDLSRVGGAQLTGKMSNRDATLQLTDLAGSLGSMSLHGWLAFDGQTKPRPQISGRVSLGKLNLEPWMADSKNKEPEIGAPLPFSRMLAVDGKLKLTVQGVAGLEKELKNLSLDLHLDDGVLSVPVALEAAGVPLSADLEIRANQEEPTIHAHVWAQDLSLNQLDSLVDVPEHLEGSFGVLDLDITSSGNSLDSLAANLLAEVHAKESAISILNEARDERIELFLSQAHATHRPGEPLVVVAEGELLEEVFALDLETAPVVNLIANDTWPLNLRFQGAGATLDVGGSLESETTGLGFDFGFALSGERLGDLSPWLAVPPQADLSYAAKGRLTSGAGTRLLRLEDFQLGHTRLTGEFARSTEHEEAPFMVDLRASTLDLGELEGLSDSIADLDAEHDVIGMDLPILPSRVSFHDAEIELVVDRLLRKPVDLSDVTATLSLRQGRLLPSPFSFSYETERFTGQIDLDLRQEIPYFALELHGSGDELGQILEREEIVENFEVAAQQLDLKIEGSGTSVREIIQSSDLSAQIIDMRWQIQPSELDEPVKVRLERVDLSGPRGKPIVLTARGTLDQEPLDLRLTLRYPEDPLEAREQAIPFDLVLGLAATDIELSGGVKLPIRMREFDMRMTVQGETVATLSNLVDMDLPNLGPYQLKSGLHVAQGRWSLEDLDFAVGESAVRGEISYRRIDERPMLSANLTSRLIRTEDFLDLGGQVDDEEATPESSETQKPPKDPNLTLDKLSGFDATVDLTIQEIFSSHGSLKSMVAHLDLERGGLDLLLKRLQESDDDFEIAFRVRPSGQGVEAKIRAHWTREPYGMFADLLSPRSGDGSWSLDTDLESRGATLREISENLSGHLYLANYPVESKSSFLDLWGGGLLTSLLPVFQIGEESRLNCSVFKFQADQGVLTPERLIIDSTRTRIAGKGTIDLPADRIRLTLKPRPKQRNLINLSTPVKIRGSVSDPDVRISTGGLGVTFFRLSLWVYTVWRDLARKPLPADGSDVCEDPFATPQK